MVMSNNIRARNWVGIVYKENAVSNLFDTIEKMAIPCLVSPLHSADDDDIKPHYHIMFLYDNATVYDNVLNDFNELGIVKTVKVCRSIVGMARYLIHLDNPKKEQFSVDSVTCFGGLDYKYIIDSPKDSLVALCDIFNIIDELHIKTWRGFITYCRFHNSQLLQRICSTTATIVCVKEYITGRRFTEEEEFLKGEIVINE